MQAIVLTAGYATRLYPLTLNQPKTLLLIGNKPMLNLILEKLEQIKEINKIHIITNNKFYNHFIEWSKTYNPKKQIKITDDNTNTNETRLGATGDINFLINKEKIDEDIFVIGSDNLFEADLNNLINFYKSKKASVTALYDVKTKERTKLYSAVSLDKNNKIIKFKEKPQNPETTLISTCIYLYPKNILKRIKEFIEDKNSPDKTGAFIEWLYTREDVYGYPLKGKWFDIGSFEELNIVRKEYTNTNI